MRKTPIKFPPYSAKMADEVSEEIVAVLQLIVNRAEQSVNMRKGLKKTIIENVSTLRNLIVKLHDCRDSKITEITKLEKQVTELKAELKGSRTSNKLGTPSINGIPAPPVTAGITLAPSGDKNGKHNPACTAAGRVASPGVGTRLYSKALFGGTSKQRFQLTVKSKGIHPSDKITEQLKTKKNPTEMQVGINKIKLLNNGKVHIETNSKQEIEALEKEINAKCGGDLEATVHKLRKPRLVIYNIPEDITTYNKEDIMLAQNPDLGLSKGDIDAKFIYVPKNKHGNLVVEVGAQTRKTLIKTKIKILAICQIDDYVTVTRCFNCSRFNHRHHDCKGEETCPLCAGSHKLKECPA
jgi:hypothetical protein